MLSVFGNSFDDQDLKAMKEVMDTHLVGMGAVTQQFETEFAKKIGFPHGVAANSCTNSFWLICKALDISIFTQIIIPNIHFFGIKNVLNLFDADTIYVDIDEKFYRITVG